MISYSDMLIRHSLRASLLTQKRKNVIENISSDLATPSLSSLVLGVTGLVQRNIDSPPVQDSLRKQPRGPRGQA